CTILYVLVAAVLTGLVPYKELNVPDPIAKGVDVIGIVWTCSKGLSGVGWRKKDGKKPSGREWEEVYANLAEGERLECDQTVDFLPAGPTKVRRAYEAPFVTCDREADYRRAWAFFASHEQRQAA
ncbi:hypothetical protein OMR07_00325, partial [Methylobacterium organophilum]|nr:hypothetical protein [Methylobacterium organophilum]